MAELNTALCSINLFEEALHVTFANVEGQVANVNACILGEKIGTNDMSTRKTRRAEKREGVLRLPYCVSRSLAKSLFPAGSLSTEIESL